MMRSVTVHSQPPDVDRSDSGAHSQQHSVPGIAHVAILMCTYNGAAFLSQQLESIARQRHENWSLHVSDDGSTDQTHALLERFADVWGRNKVRTIAGPGVGFVQNFLSLTCQADIQAEFFAWCDQDDVWSDEKLAVSVEWLRSIPADVPALYCGRTQLIDQDGQGRGLSPRFHHPPHFKNALVQSIAGGNTMVFNQAARALIVEAGANLAVPAHDWWCYQLVSGSGGVIRYDPEPRVLYRQHGDNVIGSNADWRARVRRLVMLLRGRFHEWNAQNIVALEGMRHRLSNEHQKTLLLFKAARLQSLPMRVLNMFRAGLYRQTVLGNLGLLFAIILKKI